MGNRLYVGNLAFHTTEDVLQQAFSRFGEVTEVRVMLDRESGRSRGFAFVSMATNEGAQKAIENMNGKDLDGRALRVNEAEERRERSGGGGGGGFSRGPRGGGGGDDRRGGPRGGGDRRGRY
jgi:RNA recognition motif-containing protein